MLRELHLEMFKLNGWKQATNARQPHTKCAPLDAWPPIP